MVHHGEGGMQVCDSDGGSCLHTSNRLGGKDSW